MANNPHKHDFDTKHPPNSVQTLLFLFLFLMSVICMKIGKRVPTQITGMRKIHPSLWYKSE